MYSNLTGDGTRTYTYDAADRLKTVTRGGTTTTFAYDGLGRRLKQTVGTTETRYLWCGAAICQQRSATDVVQKRFVAEGEYVLTGTKKYLALTDHLGSVRDLVDITGTPTLVGSFDYTPYGATARSWGTVTPGYTYAGLFAHPQTGLLLSATRAYDPAKGKWLNKDPIRESGGINLYGYVGASPMMGSDPLGLDGIIVNIGITIGGSNDKRPTITIRPVGQPPTTEWYGAYMNVALNLAYLIGHQPALLATGDVENYTADNPNTKKSGGACFGKGISISWTDADEISDLLGDSHVVEYELGILQASVSKSLNSQGKEITTWTFGLGLGAGKFESDSGTIPILVLPDLQ